MEEFMRWTSSLDKFQRPRSPLRKRNGCYGGAAIAKNHAPRACFPIWRLLCYSHFFFFARKIFRFSSQLFGNALFSWSSCFSFSHMWCACESFVQKLFHPPLVETAFLLSYPSSHLAPSYPSMVSYCNIFVSSKKECVVVLAINIYRWWKYIFISWNR